MREIKRPQYLGPDLKRLTIDSARIHLFACSKNVFALARAGTWETLYIFESAALTEYLKKGIGQIHCASLHENACRIGHIRRLEIELRLKMSNESVVTITDRGKVLKTYELSEHSRYGERMFSPLTAWDILPEPPFVWMRLTGRLIDHIESFSMDEQQKHLLTIMWKEYELTSKAHDSCVPITVQCEFLDFLATRINQYLVKFDLT